MKISEMDNNQAMDAMVRISGVLNFILEDQEVKQLMEDLGSEDGEEKSWIDAITAYMPRIVTLAAKKHRESLFEIVGALEGKDTKAVAKMNFKKTVQTIMENWSDLKDFFTYTESTTGMTGT